MKFLVWSVDDAGAIRIQFHPEVIDFVTGLLDELETEGDYTPVQPHLTVSVTDELAAADPLLVFEASQTQAGYQERLERHWDLQDQLVGQLFGEDLRKNPQYTIAMDVGVLTLLHQWFARTALTMSRDKLEGHIGVGEPLFDDEDLQQFLESAADSAGTDETKVEDTEQLYGEQRTDITRAIATTLAIVQHRAIEYLEDN